MKTIKEWLEQLDEPYRSQALKNMRDQAKVNRPPVPEETTDSIHSAIDRAFIWHYTPEGDKYWSEIHKQYENENN